MQSLIFHRYHIQPRPFPRPRLHCAACRRSMQWSEREKVAGCSGHLGCLGPLTIAWTISIYPINLHSSSTSVLIVGEFYWCIPKVSPIDEETKDKIRELSQSDIPIDQRRALYNQLGRRMKHKQGLKPGLIQKYSACLGNSRERFQLLKEFLIDENLFET